MLSLSFNYPWVRKLIVQNWPTNTISKTSVRVSSGFQTQENVSYQEVAGRAVLLFSSVWKPDETRSTNFEITSPTQKISRNYRFIWGVECKPVTYLVLAGVWY